MNGEELVGDSALARAGGCRASVSAPEPGTQVEMDSAGEVRLQKGAGAPGGGRVQKKGDSPGSLMGLQGDGALVWGAPWATLDGEEGGAKPPGRLVSGEKWRGHRVGGRGTHTDSAMKEGEGGAAGRGSESGQFPPPGQD